MQGAPGNDPGDPLAMLKKPVVVGLGAAIGGLILGVIIGRTSVGGQPSDPPPSAAADERLTANRPEQVAEDVVPEGPLPWYRIYFGRPLPKSARGFERIRGGARPASRLLGKEANVELELEPKPGAYVVTIVASLESAKKGTLNLLLDGQPLGLMELSSAWQIHAVTLPAGLLTSGRKHTLALRVEGAGQAPIVNVDSLAVAPVGSEASLEMGAPSAVGALVDGFGRPSATHVWNQGERSILGVVLEPVAGDYRLSVRGSTLPQLDPLTVTAKVNGTSVGAAVFGRHSTEASWSVPVSALRSGLNRIELNYPKTIKPSDLKPGSKDDRPLAVRFKYVGLKPAR